MVREVQKIEEIISFWTMVKDAVYEHYQEGCWTVCILLIGSYMIYMISSNCQYVTLSHELRIIWLVADCCGAIFVAPPAWCTNSLLTGETFTLHLCWRIPTYSKGKTKLFPYVYIYIYIHIIYTYNIYMIHIQTYAYIIYIYYTYIHITYVFIL